MNPANGHADNAASNPTNGQAVTLPLAFEPNIPASTLSGEKIRDVVAALEVPFDPAVVEWRVTNMTQDKRRGQFVVLTTTLAVGRRPPSVVQGTDNSPRCSS